MKKTDLFWRLVFLALFLTVIFVFLVFFLIWQRLDPVQAGIVKGIAYQNIYYLLLIITTVPVAIWVVFEICYTRFYLPLKRIPSETSIIYRTNPTHRLEFDGNHNIAELCLAINDFAQMYENLGNHIAEEIATAQGELEKERNLLASIMAELPFGLIICNSNGRILLSNSQAKIQLARNTPKRGSEYFLGLGRSIYNIIDRSLITHALQEMEERLNSGRKRTASYFVTQVDENLPLLVEAIPVLNQERHITGFILSLQDISVNIERYELINQNLLSFDQSIKTYLWQIQEILHQEKQAEPDIQHRIEECCAAIGKSYHNACAAILDAAFETMPLSRLNLEHFLFAVQKRAGLEKDIRINVSTEVGDIRILGDTYSLVAALVFIIEKLAHLTSVNEFELQTTAEANKILLDISWEGNPVPSASINDIFFFKLHPLSHLGYILKQNKASITALPAKKEMCSQVRITTTAESKVSFVDRRRAPVVAGSRPEYYDFNLFEIGDESDDLLNSSLTSLTYSVIDTETTGLDPAGGDEIIAIGAVRIVKNRIVLEDFFDQLVNPGRDIPFESYKIHGIAPTMVADKPTIDTILPGFKRYISKTVIVGHDVAFDMKMLKLKEKSTGVVFNNPILDTLLLSAMLHPINKQHNIESVARRLGVTIVGRHTALGDAMATAEILLKLIPILEEKGIITLKHAIEASKRTYFLRLRY